MRKLLVLSLIAVSCAVQAAHIKVFVLTGQSNSLGTSNGTETDKSPGFDPADANILFWWENWASATASLGTSTNRITQLQVQQGGYYAGSATHWGPEFGFGRAMWNAGSRDLMIVKCSRGGGGNSYWHKPAVDHHMYTYVVNAVSNALKALVAKGHTFEICGLLYLQGESNNSTEANEAGTRFRALIDNLRQDLPNASGMRGYIAGISAAGTDRDTTRMRQDALAGQFAPEIVYFPDMDLADECVPVDNLHFNVRAKLTIGARLADAIVGRTAAYDADLISTNAQNPMLQGWSETVATAVTGQAIAGLAPDVGFTNNAWQISDASGAVRGHFYSRPFSNAQCSWARGLGWSVTAECRFVSGYGTTNKAWVLQYGDTVDKWLLWGHLDPADQLIVSWDKDAETSISRAVVVQPKHDGVYHRFTILNPCGTGAAKILVDDQEVGQAMPIPASMSALPAGLNWGTASAAGMVKANWRSVEFRFGQFRTERGEWIAPKTWGFAFQSNTNRTYNLMRSSDFLTWSIAATNIVATGSRTWAVDTNEPGGCAFYRVRMNP